MADPGLAMGEFKGSLPGNKVSEAINCHNNVISPHLLTFRQYEDYNIEYILAKKDVAQYLGNPVNAFKIIKRLLIDWKKTLRIVEYSTQMGKENHHCKKRKSIFEL